MRPPRYTHTRHRSAQRARSVRTLYRREQMVNKSKKPNAPNTHTHSIYRCNGTTGAPHEKTKHRMEGAAEIETCKWKRFDTCLEFIYGVSLFSSHLASTRHKWPTCVYFVSTSASQNAGKTTPRRTTTTPNRSIDCKACTTRNTWPNRSKPNKNKTERNEPQVGYKIFSCDHSSNRHAFVLHLARVRKQIHCQRYENINAFATKLLDKSTMCAALLAIAVVAKNLLRLRENEAMIVIFLGCCVLCG